MLLELRQVTKAFGGLIAVNNFTMSVNPGEIIGLIGPNGAGKTTIFNLITGVFKPDYGKILFDGKDITGMPPYKIAELGIGRTFQHNPLFEEFTVLQNILASFHLRPRSSLLATILGTRTYRHNEKVIFERAIEILSFLDLENLINEKARNLPHGFRVMLGIARALAIEPRLLLLDEPTSGMAPHEIDRVVSVIEKINSQGVSVVLIEHNMDIIDICHRIVVMNFGEKLTEGTPEQIKNDSKVIEAYLGARDVA